MRVTRMQAKKIADNLGIGEKVIVTVLKNCKTVGDVAQLNMGAKDKELEISFKANLINLMYVNKGTTVIKMRYPYLWQGALVSAAGVVLMVAWLIVKRRNNN